MSYGAAKGSKGKFFVDRDYATFILSAKNDVATALSYLNVSKVLEHVEASRPETRGSSAMNRDLKRSHNRVLN